MVPWKVIDGVRHIHAPGRAVARDGSSEAGQTRLAIVVADLGGALGIWRSSACAIEPRQCGRKNVAFNATVRPKWPGAFAVIPDLVDQRPEFSDQSRELGEVAGEGVSTLAVLELLLG